MVDCNYRGPQRLTALSWVTERTFARWLSYCKVHHVYQVEQKLMDTGYNTVHIHNQGRTLQSNIECRSGYSNITKQVDGTAE